MSSAPVVTPATTSPIIRMPLNSLRPTQITVGLFEVQQKRKKLESLAHREQLDFLRTEPLPAILGPSGHSYIIDHHHLGRAALDANLTDVFVQVIFDLSTVAKDDFWPQMLAKCWVHPYDEHGVQQSFDAIPHHISHLKDDPFRSFAGLVRHAGGFTKTPTPFAEFAWADYFRRNLSEVGTTKHMDALVAEGVRRAKLPIAKALPGFAG